MTLGQDRLTRVLRPQILCPFLLLDCVICPFMTDRLRATARPLGFSWDRIFRSADRRHGTRILLDCLLALLSALESHTLFECQFLSCPCCAHQQHMGRLQPS